MRNLEPGPAKREARRIAPKGLACGRTLGAVAGKATEVQDEGFSISGHVRISGWRPDQHNPVTPISFSYGAAPSFILMDIYLIRKRPDRRMALRMPSASNRSLKYQDVRLREVAAFE
jgi:hypothetical protein